MNSEVNILDKLLEKGVLVLIVFTPLAFGTVQKWSVSLLEICAFLLLALLLLKQLMVAQPPAPSHFEIRTARILKTICLLFTGLVLLQLLPLPLPLLKMISPASQYVHTTLGGATTDAWRTISISPYATRQDLLLLLSYAAIFSIIVLHYRTRKQVETLVTAILVMGGLLVLIAILQKAFWNGRIFWFYPVDEYLASGSGIWGPYINRNHFAGYLEMLIPLALGMLLFVAPTSHSLPGTPMGIRISRFLENQKTPQAAAWFLLVLVMTAAVFATLCRGGIAALAIAFCFFVLITRNRRSLRSRSLLLAMVAFVLAVVVVFASWDSLEDRFEALDTGHVGRLNVWKDSLGIVKDFPLLGSGLGTFDPVFRRYQTTETRAIYDHAHNDYVELLTDTGSLGLVLAVTAAAVFLIALYRRWRRWRGMYAKCIGAGGLSSCCVMGVHSVTDFNLHIPANALLLTIIAALTYAVLFNLSDEPAEATPDSAPQTSPTSRLPLLTGILLLAALLYLPLTGLIADHRYASVARILDDKKTEELDVVALLPETASLYLAAMQMAQSAQALEPLRPLYNWTISDIAIRLGRWAIAMELLKAQLPVGMPSRDQAFGIAQTHLEKMITAEPTSPDAHLALADLQENWRNDPTVVMASLRRAIDAFPGSANVRLAVARHHFAAQRTGDALEQLRLLAKLDDSYILPESKRKADTLERRPSWYINYLYRSNLYAALETSWRITRDPLVVKGLLPEHPEAKNVLQAFMDAKRIE